MKIATWWNVRLPLGRVNIQAIIKRSVKSMTAKTAHSQLEPLVLMVISVPAEIGFAFRASLPIAIMLLRLD